MIASRRYPSSTDVARLAGVSQSAVSRTFSGGKGVSEETSRKVFAAAKELGYRPNVLPRILKHHRSNLVAIVTSGTNNPFYSATLQSFTRELQNNGYQALLVQVDDDHSLDGAVPRLASYRVDAIVSALPVLSKAAAEALADVRVPTISFNTPVRNRWVASVCSDGAGGAAAVAELFLARGAKRFGFIAGSEGSHASQERLQGYRATLLSAGFKDISVTSGDYSYEGGYAAALDLAERGRMPTALFCANDLMALGVLDALRYEIGLAVPDDVMVAGFDDVPEASWKAYDLTTVLQDGESMVLEAVTVLRQMISANRSTGGILRTVPGRLVERATTRRGPRTKA
ncbi:LacI family DNA-binding transcriptional regulator [Bauldia sp.]|uniref:LacI family DNA-binding transcriptional regulator n=1 Tax=Bauldia sp. TaxID=2575872 RepID=UPI0025B9A4CB|nr:LacI family DNA-binding transcriptional regulator [Bauldia sp.]